MERAEFERKLTEFFNRHAPSKVFLVPRLASEFKGKEDTVFDHLNKKYNKNADGNEIPVNNSGGGEDMGPPMSGNTGAAPIQP